MKTKQDFPITDDRQPEGLKEDGSKFRVLVVDDSAFLAAMVTKLLLQRQMEKKVLTSIRNSVQMSMS